MKAPLLYITLAFLLISNSSCSNKAKKDPLLQEAFKIHTEYLKIAEESQKALNKMPRNNSDRQKLQTQLSAWGENIIEVPGFPHTHSKIFEHHHHHGDQIELSSEDMLSVQKELMDSVKVINQRIQGIILE